MKKWDTVAGVTGHYSIILVATHGDGVTAIRNSKVNAILRRGILALVTNWVSPLLCGALQQFESARCPPLKAYWVSAWSPVYAGARQRRVAERAT